MSRVLTLLTTLLLAACQTTGASDVGAPQAPPAVQPSHVQKTESPSAPAEPLIYGEDLTDEFAISKSLRSGEAEVVMLTPEGVNINEIPEGLDMWLSRIKDSGGTVKAQAKPEPGAATRGFLGIFVDVALYLIGLAKDEYVYSPADNYDARLIFDKATGNVEQVLFIKRAANP